MGYANGPLLPIDGLAFFDKVADKLVQSALTEFVRAWFQFDLLCHSLILR